MAIGSLSGEALPTGVSVPSTPSVPKAPSGALPKPKAPKGPPPVKINTMTGKGTPGGFIGGSNVKPSAAAGKLAAGNAALAAQSAKLGAAAAAIKSGLIPPVPGLAAGKAKLAGLLAKNTARMKSIAKAPDMSKKFKVPAPPKVPEPPDTSGLNLPSIPSVPVAPATPSVPSVASGPKLPSFPKG